MKKILKISAFVFLTALSVIGKNSYADTTPTASLISFHDARKSREWKIIDSDLYHSFISKHPDINIYSSVVDLDGKGVGSIFIQFRSRGTCNSDGCVTTVVHYNQQLKSWTEILNHRTRDIWIGGPSPTSSGANMKEIFTSDKLMWRWIGEKTYYPEIRSLGKLWPDSSESYGDRRKVALDHMPEEIPLNYRNNPQNYIIDEIPLNLNGIGGQYILIYNYMPICSKAGCPFIIVSGANENYQVKGHGVFNSLGVTMPNSTNGPVYAPFAVQVNNGIAYYRYNNSKYELYKTTYPSNVTRTP